MLDHITVEGNEIGEF